MNLLTMEHVSKAYTDRVLLDDVGFGINKNEKIGVIGVNGMGKSTLLKIVAGIEESDAGTISMGNQVKICYLPQTPVFEAGTTILRAATEGNYDELNRWTIEAEAKSMLNQLGFTDYDEKIEHMSGGQKKRVALVRALLTPADILVLDEPTNHLDMGMLEWLEDYEYCKLGLPQPNLVLFLSLPLELSQKLLAKRYDGDASKKDIHEADLAYLEQCDRAARYAGEKLGWQFVEVSDGRQLYPVEQIRDELYRRIQEAFAC